ncbi:nuclease-related domain-containing protein [Actinomyces sp. HMSC065F12]|uniref:nuclease-related domain-containing protein n=1 Tax=Actinomyces sp. HMSC065F12 TaxID=1739479 RepID=UPI0008A4D5E7|nr:nuclease-related domain-containing protein [Actinomyces sp. HMSC065F12]OFP74399.1 hypothetical protein HMPREF2975_07325 [Actinomyces sp. HMSC065F12]
MKRSTLQRGRIIGTPGGSLNETATWAKNQHVVKAGHDAEVKTGEKLNQWALCEGGPTVLHDLHIPGSNANIDHVVVSGTKVLMIDSKAWKPATYWTIFGHTYRGSQRFEPADAAPTAFLNEQLARMCPSNARIMRPVIAVWSSNGKRQANVMWLRHKGATVANSNTFMTVIKRRVGMRPADPNIVAALSTWVAQPAHTRQ